MDLRELFDALGVTLQDARWSWGGVRESDKSVFLCVWQDSIREIDGKRHVWVSDVEGADESLGARELLAHIGLIRSGYVAYIVQCRPEDEETSPKPNKAVHDMEVLVGAALLKRDDGFWLEVADRSLIRAVMAPK